MSEIRAPILSVDHVGVRFGGLVAIADLHFDVHPGEIVSLIGPNGAGKTTAFNVMTGFLKPSQGQVRFRGTSLQGLQPHEIVRLGLSRTFQRTSVFPDDTVFDNVMIGLHRRGRARLVDTLLRRTAPARRLCETGPVNSSTGSGSPAGPRRKPGPWPMANNASSGSRWRWPPSLPCCSSTSRSRA